MRVRIGLRVDHGGIAEEEEWDEDVLLRVIARKIFLELLQRLVVTVGVDVLAAFRPIPACSANERGLRREEELGNKSETCKK
jgi:hypothetical protein